MSRWGSLAVVALIGCGRLGFDPVGDAGADAGADAGFTSVSCTDLAPTCGPSGTSGCCDSPIVPGGTFYRAYDVAADLAHPDMTHPATVASFRLDRYDITVGRFRAFVAAGLGTQQAPPAAGAGAHAAIPNSGWDPSWNASLLADPPTLIAALDGCAGLHTWTDTPGPDDNRPINCMSWYEAMAFCIWDGGYLPTDAEWNFAASGGAEQRAYPWSNPAGSLVIDGQHASYFDGTDCVGDGQPGCALTDLTPAGSKPAGDGAWGHADLAGNVFEWLLDSPGPTLFVDPCDDCADLTPSASRFARGGSYRDDAIGARTGVRSSFGAFVRADVFGARCARPR